MWLQTLISNSPLLYMTQSYWRDEAYSVLLSSRPVMFFLPKLSFETPVYYLLLHVWMKLFGTGEIAVRSLSLVGFSLSVVVVIFWSEKIFKKHFLSWFMPIFYTLNPMLLYYAFEVRAYGWYMFFACLTMYAYSTKRWKLYTVAAILGFYTHTYFIFIPFVSGIHGIIEQHKQIIKSPLKIFRLPVFLSSLVILLCISPWLGLIASQTGKLSSSWYYPVDMQLIRSVLGNLFVGYEGTPWYGWRYTKYLSVVLLACFIYALKNSKLRKATTFLFLMVVLPLAIVIGISFFKPLFVNRYLLPVTIAQIILLCYGIFELPRKTVQYATAAIMLLFVVMINIWYPNKHAKIDVRTPISQITASMGKYDVLYAGSPLVLFESMYYTNGKGIPVYLYNPSSTPFPWYVGDAIVTDDLIVKTLPTYPSRAFILEADGSYSIAYTMPIQSQNK